MPLYNNIAKLYMYDHFKNAFEKQIIHTVRTLFISDFEHYHQLQHCLHVKHKIIFHIIVLNGENKM